MPADLQHAVILKRTGTIVEFMDNQDLLRQYPTMGNGKDTLGVTDPAELATCLNRYTPIASQSEGVRDDSAYQVVSDQQPYLVFFVLKNGDYLAKGFTTADVPAFVKQYFTRQQD
jgi:hypothetical protein